MPATLVVAIMEAEEAVKFTKKMHARTTVGTIEVHDEHLRTYPFESILEIYVRPVACAVVRACRQNRT